MVHSLIKALGLLTPSQDGLATVRPMGPVRATLKDLSAYHTDDYLQFILDSKNVSKWDRNTDHITEFGLEEVRIMWLSGNRSHTLGLSNIRRSSRLCSIGCWCNPNRQLHQDYGIPMLH